MQTQEISLFEVIHTQRAIRRFTDDPVSDEAIQRILEAAVRAPSGRNKQPWRFIVIRDAETKQKIGDYYRRACEQAGIGQEPIPGLSKKVNESVAHLARHMGDAPVLILVCYEYVTEEAVGASTLLTGSSIYPAVQNLLLAARALGLGTALTTVHSMFEERDQGPARHSRERADGGADSPGLSISGGAVRWQPSQARRRGHTL